MEQGNDLLQKISAEYKNMSKGQKQIAQFILENYDKAAFITASKMGQIVGISESTVVRFAYAMGYDGYPELQHSLQELIRNKLTSVQRIALSADMQDEDVLKSVLKADMNNIRSTIETIDDQAFEEAIRRLLEAKTVYVIGLRSSTPLAQFLSYYLNFVLSNVRLVTSGQSDVFEQLIDADENDLVMAISFPRYSKRTVDALRFAKRAGTGIIALTDSLISPLAEFADICLCARSDMASFADSLVAPLSLLNAIIVALSRNNTQELTERFDRLEEMWNSTGVYINADG